MKYSELISFNPIEDIIQLKNADNAVKAREYVKSYVMSNSMAESLQVPVIDQLQMDEVVDNHGVLVVGNYGTGKSHLMSVISAVATDAENLQYLQNKDFAKRMAPVAGKFEVLRIEIGGVTMSLREIIGGFIEDDFAERGIDFEVPDLNKVRDNKKLIKDIMAAFATKYPDKGYMIVIDEFLAYLTSRNQQQIVLDLEFFRALGEMCSKSKLRIIVGVQEKIFDNPKFGFVSDTLRHVSDRFTQIIITKEATAYVVSERILKKTAEQKALIRQHLEKFTNLYAGMSTRLDEFVSLYPIHPAYIEVLNKTPLIENRHILKNISLAIKEIFNTNVPADAPGVISFDNYWPAIKNNGLLKSNPTVSKVVNASQQLEDIINRGFPRRAYKPLAMKIIYALSVHRLTTNGLDVKFGLTAENLKDDLCLFMSLPEQDADFLLGTVNATLKSIISTVSGQFIIHNEANNQYYIDVDKTVDYEEKVKQKASILADRDLNRYFYNVVYSCMEWDAKQYVTNFNIYEYDLNWDSHNIYREGYLFMGLPEQRSTAQPERDFYIHIMPPYDEGSSSVQNLADEIYLSFKSKDDFKEDLGLFAAAKELALISEGKDKEAYEQKAVQYRKKLMKYLNDNKNTCFDVIYNKNKKQLIEVLKGKYRPDMTFKDTIDLASSTVFDGYFSTKYPDFPVMKTKITRKNLRESVKAAYDHFAGRKTNQSTAMLQSFGLLDGDKIKPEGSKYAAYYIQKLQALPNQGVLNYSDLFDVRYMDEGFDKRFNLSYTFTPIIFLALVYAGYAVMTMGNGIKLTAGNLDVVPRTPAMDLFEFKYISKPSQLPLAEIKKLFEVMGINPALLDNPNTRDNGIRQMLDKAQELRNSAVMGESKLNNDFVLWGEPLANPVQISKMQDACKDIKEEFSNYSAKFNTYAKLNNFRLTMADIDALAEKVKLMSVIGEFLQFKTDCTNITGYMSNIEYLELGENLKTEIVNAKTKFRTIRDSILTGAKGAQAAQQVNASLAAVKADYINFYMDEHKKKRLDITEAKRKGELATGVSLTKLKKLRGINGVVSTSKLTALEKDLSSLNVCYELTATDLQTSHICPHCRFALGDGSKNVVGQLDNIETRIDALVEEWTKTLKDTLSDTLIQNQIKFLKAEQQTAVKNFIATGSLPKRVDDFFVKAINDLLKGFDAVEIDTDDLINKLEQLPPMDEATFTSNIKSIIGAYIKGRDSSKLRIKVKRK